MLSKIKGLLRFKGFKLFTRPYELNIVGLRSKSTVPNKFDDELHVFYMVNASKWEYHVFKITTDPGTFWLNNPMQPQGTAILAEGQYLNSHALGLHRGQYKALVQKSPITIMRDYDRNAVLDFYNGKKESGQYGINIHRANKTGTTLSVDRNSAGCQVFANASDFELFLKMCEQHRSRFGNNFTYTLIDFRSVQRRRFRITAYALGTAALVSLVGYQIYKTNKQTKLSHV
ncbi:MAG: hypothetical protein JNL60_10470 [Bacteroidia bacterium]|nr:hypothetical protein [Bacteroidia bacterium]